ncbi:MAG: hypothetical protein GQ534_09925 [Candidatus Delongbacteria bacterium]|nr:hypothetical protein [Candidatus Delongbacteria bacterium]
MGRKILFDGKIIFKDNLKIEVDSPAFNFGYGLFETILYENKKIFFIKDHLKRLNNTCIDLKIPKPNPKLVNDINIVKMISENNLFDKSVKIKLQYLPLNSFEKWNTIIRTEVYDRKTDPVELVVSSSPRSNKYFRHKTMSYMENMHLQNVNKKYNEVLFVNSEQNVIEGTKTNIIAIRDKSLYFVDGKNDYLFGIMQQNLIKDHRLFGFKKIQALGEGFSKEFLENCDEVLLTNSLKIASNVKSITFGDDIIEYKSCKIASIIRDHYLKG